MVDYGVYNVVAGFVSMFAFLNTSLSSCIQRFYNYEYGRVGEEGFHRVYVTSFFIQIVLSITVLLLVESIGLWYLNNKLVIPSDRLNAARTLFHASAISMSIIIMQVPYSAAIMAKEKMDYYAIVGIIDVLLKLLIVYLLQVIPGDRLSSYGWLLLLISLIDFLLYYIYAKLKIRELFFNSFFDRKLFSQMLAFSGWSMLGSFAQVIRNQGLNMVLNLFFGPVVNAARGLSYQIKSALSSFMASIPTAARPQLVESYAKGNLGRAKQIMYSISKVCFFIVYMIALPLAYEMNFVIHLWLGTSIPDHTISFSRIILIISMVETLNWPVSMIMYASGRIGWYNIITSLLGILTVPICYLLLTHYRIPEVAYYVSLLISVLVQTASIICMKAVISIPISEYIREVIRPSLLVVSVTFLLPALVTRFMVEGWERLFIVFAIGVFAVGIASLFIGMNKQERSLFMSLISKHR